MKSTAAHRSISRNSIPGCQAVTGGRALPARRIAAVWIAVLGTVAFLSAAVVQDARAGCDAATYDSAVDNCATLITSVTDNTIFYTDAGPTPAITFTDTTCTSPPCALDNSATALHGFVSNTGDGTFTYTFDDNTYSGLETITYTKSDGTTGSIQMTVCAVDPCTISNPTADIGTYSLVDNTLKYTPDVTKFGQPLTDNLAYTVTDKNGHQTTVNLTYVYPTFSTSGVTVTYNNGGLPTQTFRHIEQGTSYSKYPHGSAWFSGDDGRSGGAANSLVMNNALDISTIGDNSPGIDARSIGGTGQGGENGGTRTFLLIRFYGAGGDGGWGGRGGDVVVNNTGNITTNGSYSHGIWALSKGGDGGWGGNGSGLVSSGGSGAPGGPGGAVTVNSVGNITTLGSYSDGIRAESLSGQGGRGGNSGGWFTTGGNGSFGVPSGPVLVDSTGDIATGGYLSHGIFAQSIGGGGGNGGDASGWFTGDAGDGGGAGNGGTVTVRSTGSIATAGNASDGIFAQSVGGGGGGGGDGSGWYAVGGNGVAAGDGNVVDVRSTGGSITTAGSYSNGIFAQSVGGGGGGGGSATAVGAFFSFGLGGNGGDGGTGKTVTVLNDSDIHTGGENSYGILAQSVGGGGGSGGYSIAASVGVGFSAALSIGGSGAKGGNAGAVSVTNTGAIGTDNNASHGIFAQSVGGTGGNGGFAIAGAISDQASLSLSFGGSGGGGGTSGPVDVTDSGGSIVTLGDKSYGILAQSIGGGGGNGGFSIAGGIGGSASLNFSMAGGGGAGNRSSTVSVSTGSDIGTAGNDSHAIFAQSVGGGGGSGGFSVAGGISGGATIGASVGGSGGAGANADNVTVSATGNEIATLGDRSYGILAQSVGGGGGDGGFSVTGAIGGGPSLGLSFGGSGGAGAAGGTVQVDSTSSISTLGRDSHALFAQSVGGGGGSGGFSVAGSISNGSANLAFGGSGGAGGRSGPVLVDSAGATIHTSGERSYGILAQSVGGSGGDGGFAVAGGISAGPAFNLAMGGSGGAGGVGGAVSVIDASDVFTDNNSSHGIFAQSVGGGGGSGGFSVTGGISASSAAIGAAIGGSGGNGAAAGTVNVATADNSVIQTLGNRSYGILAQSMGGSGGDGGFSVAGGISNSASVNFAMGGSGGNGGAGNGVTVTSGSDIGTWGDDSHALFAQSVGGGGGSGGFSVAGSISASSASVSASIGGSGGGGAQAGTVDVTSTGSSIGTAGDRSYGILAQSIGGTGGDGGFSVAAGISNSASVNFSMGGSGGSGGAASSVTVDSESDIWTSGIGSHALFAQSVGGGGGSGGFSVTGGISASSAAVGASIGGSGGGGASAGSVTVTTADNTAIQTSGERSYGILAQSIGGTGGDGGFSVAGGISKGPAVNFSMGGSGGTGGAAGPVSVTSGTDIVTLDNNSHALFAQSVGGGGGSGGFSVTGGISADSAAIGASIGGSGGNGARADNVTVSSTAAAIGTAGARSYGILAQSIGGTGGDGGFSVAGSISKSAAVSFSMGGAGGSGGVAGAVSLDSATDVATLGDESHGIFAQSVGGGGGSGGFSVAGSISWDNAAASVAASIGGSGGDGSNAGTVHLTSTGSQVATAGDRSYGILAQSVGGTGGDGGFSVAGSISKSRGISFSMGGSGGTGGIGSGVDLDSWSSVYTLGDDSHGLFAQSVGGGGGSGGFSVAGSVSADNSAVAAVSVSVGGSGGGGGRSGNVTLDSAGAQIETFGLRSYGILAQSVGGTGGDGGFSVAGNISRGRGVAFSMGGSGGAGGDAGTVHLTNASDVVTHDNNSHAIFGQSVGGGGGSGGFSVAGSVSSDNSAFSALAASIGGFGAAGGSADNVTVESTGGHVVTYGTRSYGILAQSVGGGGGDGGFSVAGGIAKGGGATFSMGGWGAAGGSGGNVLLSSDSSVGTLGEESHGLFAQSVGGGGGSGGFSVAGTVSWDNAAASVGISVGGFGGDGGDGGDVEVDSAGSQIVTASDKANGILAQSIGGGGGNGGFSIAGSVGTDNASKNISVSIGGFGGDGGTGGLVDVSNSSAIATQGIGSEGIFAQSVGGGGGSGGFSVAGGWGGHGSKNISLALGGFGGDGDYADNVTVMNDGAIDTWGFQSHGIFAQSVGGGGGKGGWSAAIAVGSAGDNTTKNVNLGVSVGGFGGDGGYAGAVRVENTDSIVTRGVDAQGILAQSIGGGGGQGGAAFSGVVSTGGSDNGAVVNVATAVGGSGGDGNHGGAVTVVNSGSIATLNDGSNAIFAQSVGGGGGNGGKANTLSLVLDKSCGLPLVCKAPASDNNNWSFQVAVGGFGGGASNGGAVNVTNSGAINAQGVDSSGIFAQSIGGGGGTGGNGTLGTDNVLPMDLTGLETAAVPFSHVGYLRNWQAVVGGDGGSSGDGGDVQVSNTGNIAIYGATTTIVDGSTTITETIGSYGIFAQSVGAGGGVGGNATTGLTGKIGIGGGAGSAGDGGNVTVSNSGRIDTFGGGGHAILAQSVGGGGGIAGDVKRTKIPLTDINTGANLAFGRGGGNSGDGGDVVVNNTGIVTTQGTTSFGILAQSVGGGGGIAGNPGLLGIPLGAIYDWFAGSVGGDGSGGAVTVTHSGTIVTNDNASHGIFAQSAGGNGYGGTVRVTVSGDILAAGEGSTGVFAQSRGDLGGADITIDILGGTVLGGSGTGAGVRMLEGDNNVLTNHGMVTTALAAGGWGIAAGTGDETIENFGTVTGSVDLGTGGNAFNNRAAGTFNPGQTVSLGSGNFLLNEGTLSPGDAGVQQHTQLTGNLVQTGTGTFLVDLDHQSGRSDRLIVDGTSELSGQLSVNLANPGYVPPGTQRFLVFSGLDNVTDSGLTLNAPASAVVAYGWTFEPREIEIVTRVNYAAAGLSGNAAAIGQAVNEIQLAGGTAGFAPVAATLVGLPGLPELEQAYDQMSPDPYDNFTKSGEQVTRLSTRTLLKRIHSVRIALNARDDRGEGEAGEPVRLASRGGDASVRALLPGTGERTRSRYGMWFDVFGQAGDQDTVNGRTGYDYTAAGVAAGLDSLFGDRFLAGFAVGGSGTYVDLDEGRGNGDIQTVSGAVYASYFTASRYLDAAVSVGTQSYSNARYVAVGGLGGVATSEHGAVVYTGYVEGGENFRLPKCVLQPYAALQYISLDERGFTESGAGPLDLVVQDRRTDSLASELGLRLDGIFETESGTLIPEFSLAWNHDFAIDDRVVTASFASAPFADFSVAGQEVEKNGLVVGAGITFQSKVGVSAALKYRGEFRENFHSNEILGEMIRYEF